jgi:hypothetical protein
VAASRSTEATCEPGTGIMTVYLKNDPITPIEKNDQILIQSGMMRLIRWGMQENLYVSGNVQHVSFIGTRLGEETFDSVGKTEIDAVQESQNRLSGNPQTAGIIGGFAAVVLLVASLLFVFARPKRDTENPNEELEEADPSTSRITDIAEPATNDPKVDDHEKPGYAPWLQQQNAMAPPAGFDFEAPKPPLDDLSFDGGLDDSAKDEEKKEEQEYTV